MGKGFEIGILGGRRESLRLDVEFQGFGKGVCECKNVAETFATKYKSNSLSNIYDGYLCAYTETYLHTAVTVI